MVGCGEDTRKAEEKAISIADPIVEREIRRSLKKPEGELTEADLEEVTRLKLGLTEITDACLKDVAKLQKLTSLNLWDTQITDAGIKEFIKLQKLKLLYLLGTRITAEGEAELKKALPNCSINNS